MLQLAEARSDLLRLAPLKGFVSRCGLLPDFFEDSQQRASFEGRLQDLDFDSIGDLLLRLWHIHVRARNDQEWHFSITVTAYPLLNQSDGAKIELAVCRSALIHLKNDSVNDDERVHFLEAIKYSNI